MPEGNAEQVVVRGKTVIWIARYSQILTFLLAQAISVVACVSLFLMLAGDRQLEEVEVSETVVMVGCGCLADTYCRSSCQIHSARAGHEAGKASVAISVFPASQPTQLGGACDFR